MPNVEGGGVESLITILLESNDVGKHYQFDVYTVDSPLLDSVRFQNTNVIQIRKYRCKRNRNALYRALQKIGNDINQLVGCRNRSYVIRVCEEVCRNQGKYDIVLVENSVELYAEVYSRLTDKTRLAFHMHGCNYDKALLDLVGRTAGKLLVVSNSVAEYVKGVCAHAAPRILYNCIDDSLYDITKRDDLRKKSRDRYGIDDGQTVILYSGRLVEDKGVDVLYRAFVRITKDYPEVVLVYVGTAGYGDIEIKSEVEAQAKKDGLIKKRKAIFTGYVKPDDMPAEYAMADMMVVPSLLEEPFGLVAIEGMAMGLPLIVTNSGGLREIVSEQCAVVLEKNEALVENLAEALARLAEDGAVRQRMGMKAYQRFQERPEFHASNYLKNFSELLEL